MKEYFRFQGASVILTMIDEELGHVSHLWSNVRNRGDGKKVMLRLIDHADKYGITLMLVPRPYDIPQRGALEPQRLVKFYTDLGFSFVADANGLKIMTRLPRGKNMD